VKRITGRASAHVDAPPDRVFDVITDLGRLPAWNRRMLDVVTVPHELREGSEWVVRLQVFGRRFTSRSHVIELDRAARRFVHRSKPEDDNPSFTVWTWRVEPAGGGSTVTVEWDMRPVTLVRRWVMAPVRDRHMRRGEAAASLAALARVC
jgi:uncharacterized protein YndB with AHSA1/START domain